MNTTALRWLGRPLAVAAVAFLIGCAAEAPSGVARARALPGGLTAPTSVAPDLSLCPRLQVPAGSELVVRVYAKGVQVYIWSGTSWTFDRPEALLSADAEGNGIVGTHYRGPTWESSSGSKVVGTVLERCTPDPNAIQWLKLGAVSREGAGIFDRVAFILRVNTVGGIAPSAPGDFPGQEAQVPYTTEYFFYRAP